MMMNILVSDEYNMWEKWVLNRRYIRHALLFSIHFHCSFQGSLGHVIVARIAKGPALLLG